MAGGYAPAIVLSHPSISGADVGRSLGRWAVGVLVAGVSRPMLHGDLESLEPKLSAQLQDGACKAHGGQAAPFPRRTGCQRVSAMLRLLLCIALVSLCTQFIRSDAYRLAVLMKDDGGIGLDGDFTGHLGGPLHGCR